MNTEARTTEAEASAFLAGGGELGALIRGFDWSRTSLGPLAGWPHSLRTVTAMLLLSPVPIVLLWGEEGIMIYNDAYSVFAGGRHPQLLGSEVRKGWPEVADFNDNVMKVGLAGGTLAYKDQELTLFRHGRPEQVWMNLDYSPVLDESGRPAGVIAIVVETTERVLAERHVQAEQARQSFLLGLGDALRSLSRPGEIMETACRGLGRLLGAHQVAYSEINATGDRAVVDQEWSDGTLASTIGTHRLGEFGARLVADLRAGRTAVIPDIAADSRTGTVEALAAFRRLGIGALLAVPLIKDGRLAAILALHHRSPRPWAPEDVALAEDVAERTWATVEHRRAEVALRENEARLRFLDALGKETAKSTDADVILSTTTRMLGKHLGVAVCAYADMDPDEDGFTIRGDWSMPGSPSIVGHYSLADFGRLAVRNLGAGVPLILNDNRAELPPEEAATFLAIGLAATICVPLVKEGRLTALMAIHDRVPRRWTANELALLLEVTERSWAHIERVRSEAEVRAGEQRFREELEAKVTERTAALQQAQKMEAIGNLTGGIAHDFNNLLMAVLGSLELLRKRMPDSPALLRLLDNAMEGARRGSSLTERMLAFARRQDLKTERIDLERLVAGMAELLRRSLGPTITLEVRFPRRLPPVETDPNQLEAALLNLAVNARDAMNGEGRIVVTARTEPAPGPGTDLDPGPYVCLSVSDTGEGMDEATLKRATEPFFTTKGVGKGTGLGLSMVHGLAEQSGGTLVLRSAPGAGTTAEIWLPAADAAEPRLTAPVATPPILQEEQRPLTILAVDDDALVLVSTAGMLEDLGHRVELARSGAEALELLAGQTVDLVITDHAMPSMTGAQLAAELRRRGLVMPVVLATGYAELPAGVESALPRLSKPFLQADLAEAIRKAMSVR